MRDESTSTHLFRELVDEVTLLLTYEATKESRHRGDRDRDAARANDGAADLRQEGGGLPDPARGLGMLDGVLSLISGRRVGFIGLYRKRGDAQPVEYYVKLPADVAERDVILLDPMLATGNSTAALSRP
jgi:uracil phosphoribosyltransferase